jgi:hypothetical protein
MKLVLGNVGVDYTGGDIVPALVSELQRRYETASRRFRVIDLTADDLPRVDLIISRDCLFHPSNLDILASLRNVLASGSTYFLTTTHVVAEEHRNADIVTGDFRLIDLFRAPFEFPREVLASIDDWVPPHPKRRMVLFNREQLALAVGHLEAALRVRK